MSEWFPNKAVQSVTILKEPSKYHKIMLTHISLRLAPMIHDHEMLAEEGIGYHLCGTKCLSLVYTKSIESTPCCAQRAGARQESGTYGITRSILF